MQLILAWAAVLLVFVAPYPTTVCLLKRSPFPFSQWLAAILSAGLGIGTLTWLMMLEGMLGIPFRLLTILLPFLVVCAPGTVLWWRQPTPTLSTPIQSESPRLILVGRIVTLLVSVAILFNALYWPFYKQDTLGIYADQAHFMYATGGLIPLNLTAYSYYQAYPMLVQLSYTYSYLVSGWEDPYLAKLIPTLLSLACLGAVYYLAKTLYDEKSGWLAVVFLALTPLFGRWASSGYTDLPMAFYYTLAALFVWRTWVLGNLVDALLSGITIGLGAWTKNAILPAIGFWLMLMGWGWLRKRMTFKTLLLAGIACAVVAAPWYLRNVLEVHILMPATAWTSDARPNLSNLLVFITHPENFALTGWLILISIGLAALKWVRHPRHATREILLLVFTLPYFAIWWYLASYDRRFTLYFLPMLVVLAAGYTPKLWAYIPAARHRIIANGLSVAAILFAVYIASISIDYKYAILRDPLMTSDAKYQIVLPP